MNEIIAQVCQRRCVRPEQFFGTEKASQVVAARCDAINRLKKSGLGPEKIARETKLHVQTVYYWLRPVRRARVRKQSETTFRIRRLGGRKQTKQQREEILTAYLADPTKGTALACSRGLSPLYAYKLAHALGMIPRKDER